MPARAPIDCAYRKLIAEICGLGWAGLGRGDLIALLSAYRYFSIQFRENLAIACRLYPDDDKLCRLWAEECDTGNLSPWPGVAGRGERMDHDEFLRRVLLLAPLDLARRERLEALGARYLAQIRDSDASARAASIASYEDGGLDRIFRAFLQAPDWDEPALAGFRHFLVSHIRFDSDPAAGHGALSRHLAPDDRILPLWAAFKELLLAAIPRLA